MLGFGPHSKIYMYIILPDQCDGIEALQNTFENFDPLNVIAVLGTQKTVTVMLPKFRIERLVNFNSILSEVMIKIFEFFFTIHFV